ncbi:ankyrin repeat protein, putative [Trichomonas vaginalis G3]|uniref:Ankyrin repeat protein, putative n=1 Tax=Trichomonas vaginalis (strain ATCC PRA-98 / G3) TaxID=412133 RepID=A2EQ74_TRIV3|nr:ankyrin repeat protein, putative [Trichomonas vaginalis G3]|eukprot:XP_001317380.1 ankyrin repeat protein [Trichomonas vaginalis G3]
MNNDKERFIQFTESDGFDKDQKLKSKLYPYYSKGYSLLELCCYHGAIDCFKLLRSKFRSEITQMCLKLSFLGRNQEIMSECLKYQKPDEECMEYAIISHNIDFVTYLMYEYNLEIDIYYLSFCGQYCNLESFLAYINISFHFSVKFNIPSLCAYFLSNGANINVKFFDGKTILHIAAKYNCKETAELFISHGININEKDDAGRTALHIAAESNNKETAELLISHGININEKDKDGRTALHTAVFYNLKDIAELLISHGININEKDKNGSTALHIATLFHRHKEIIELILSHGGIIDVFKGGGK